MHYVYILQDLTKKLYIGRTDDLRRRVTEHRNGKVWTTRRMKNPKLVFYEAFLSKTDAIRRERYFKTSKGRSTIHQMLRASLQRNA